MSDGIVSGVGKAGGIIGEVADLDDVGLFFEPELIAGVPPVGEVLAVDGLAAELGDEDFFDGGEFVEPGEDLRTSLAVAEALVELFADVVGEAGDFAIRGTR